MRIIMCDLDELDGVLVWSLHWHRVTRRRHRQGGQGGGLVTRAEGGVGQYSIVQYSTVQYSTVPEGGVDEV